MEDRNKRAGNKKTKKEGWGEENEGEFKFNALYNSNQHEHSGQH